MRHLPVNALLWTILTALSPALSHAAVSADEAAKLGETLTPLGAEKAGNAEGSIPAWENGITSAPPGYTKGGDHVDPFAGDQELFTITGKTVDQYREKLSPGQVALFREFPDSYQMKVFPTHRSAAFPKFIYDETVRNATRVHLTGQGDGFSGTVAGHPFPIPKNGREVMWNHMVRYHTKGYRGFFNHAVTSQAGDYVIERSYFELAIRYNHPDTTLENFQNKFLYALYKTVAPVSKAGDAYLLHLPLDRSKDQTGLWVYNPGQRKIRRIGEVGYDNPAFDGLMTHDQVDMFNGPMDRYDFKLVGKKEMYVPYNAYSLYSSKHKYKDIVLKGHINQSLPRYELHRVWVVEANVRPDRKHIYKKRVFYLDEDSWQVLLEDIYDERGEFWRCAEAHAIQLYEIPSLINLQQVHYDLQSRRYVALYQTRKNASPPSTTFSSRRATSRRPSSSALPPWAGSRQDQPRMKCAR
jgi:hypothetical protein